MIWDKEAKRIHVIHFLVKICKEINPQNTVMLRLPNKMLWEGAKDTLPEWTPFKTLSVMQGHWERSQYQAGFMGVTNQRWQLASNLLACHSVDRFTPHPESPLPPPSPSHPSGPSQCTSPEHPVSCMEPGLMIWFTYENIHVSTRLSQSIPRSPSPAESKRLFCASVSLLQSRIQGYHYHLSTFHIYALVEWIGVFLSDLFPSV